jgi:hypothetical protein
MTLQPLATLKHRPKGPARQEAATDGMDVKEAITNAVNDAETTCEALWAAQASEESAHAKLASLWSKATYACDMVLSVALSGMTLTSWIGEIPSRVERHVDSEAYFGARTMMSVVTCHYDGLDLPSISQGSTTGRSDEEIDILEEEATPAAQSLARLVSTEAVLQAVEEGEK